MARKVRTETRQDLLQAVRERYRGSLKAEKLWILDEFVAVPGYHRKHIIRLFNAAPGAGRQDRRARLPVYDEAVREALILLWEASDRICGKRLKPLLQHRTDKTALHPRRRCGESSSSPHTQITGSLWHQLLSNGAPIPPRRREQPPIVPSGGPTPSNSETDGTNVG